jgi:hypothetical protein
MILFFFISNCFAQSILNTETSIEKTSHNPPVDETILKISPSRRIFVISNENASFSNGDFITFILNDQLAARAIAVKSIEKNAGVKVIKIYSLDSWKDVREGLKIKIIRGDDSYFVKKNSQPQPDDSAQVLDEEELYDESTLIDDNVIVEEDRRRLIKTDHIAGVSLGTISSLDAEGESTNYTHYSGKYAYQFTTNYWIEFQLGQSVLRDYPFVKTEPNGAGLNTSLTTYTFRLKYTFNAPYDSYIMPYFGFQMRRAKSDEAGKNVANENSAKLELDQVDALNENKVVFGASIIKRLVPGWFITADLGNDLLNLGFSLEF